MLNAEEVFNFERAVLGQVRAMNSILTSILSELGSQCIWPQVLGNFWIHGADELSELLDCILLSDFHDYARSLSHGLDHSNELWQNSLVDLEELLGRWFIEGKHLH